MKKALGYLEIPLLVAVPAALALSAFFQFSQTGLLTAAVAIVAVAVFFVNYESSKPALRQIMPVVVLGALGAAGRILFAVVPDFKPLSAITIVAGMVFGRRSGFMVGALAALVSNFFFGQGPWTPWQMYAWGMIGYFAGVLNDCGAFRNAVAVYVYGFLSALLYGFLLNTWYLVGFVHPITWQSALLVYGAGLAMDAVHGTATVVFLLAIYAPWKKKLERIKVKYGLGGSARPKDDSVVQ